MKGQLSEALRAGEAGADSALLSGNDRLSMLALEQAESVLSARGARREADAAVRALRHLGRRVSRRARSPAKRAGLAQLSAREREVADRVASWSTNREVAAAVFLSEKTIGSHLARIYDKLGVHSRAALAAIVARETDPRDLSSVEVVRRRLSKR